MASAYPVLNLALGILGLLLLAILYKEHSATQKMTRYVFGGYYLIVLQYNHERILTFPNFLLVIVAGIVLLVWTYTSPAETQEVL